MAIYKTADIEFALGIGTSTVRKYAHYLEDSGYEFEKNSHGHRLYTDVDLIALRRLVNHMKYDDMSLSYGAKAVVEWKNAPAVADRAIEGLSFNQKEGLVLWPMAAVDGMEEHMKHQKKQLEQQQLQLQKLGKMNKAAEIEINSLKKELAALKQSVHAIKYGNHSIQFSFPDK